MACPFFHPTERFEDGMWLQPPRLPLGNPCRGYCEADAAVAMQPELDEIRNLCNLGYARGRCRRFPAAFDGADAIRFSIMSDETNAISLLCIFERDYSPSRHFQVLYDTRAGCFTSQPESEIVAAQARQFVANYLSRKLKP